MNLGAVQRIFGLLLMVFSLTMLPPIGVSVLYADGHWQPFSDAFVIVLAAGLLLWWPERRNTRELRLRDGFLVVALFWLVLGLAGAVPLVMTDRPVMSVTDAVFEAVSGFTTTGATTLIGLDELPPSLLYYRQQIQWFGGIGIVVLAVALLPVLGVGGMQLLRAETPGPVKDAKLTPRITATAKALWLLYLALTVACALGYYLAGMNAFDAITHSFTTVSSGGYSTHDASLAHFDSVRVEIIAPGATGASPTTGVTPNSAPTSRSSSSSRWSRPACSTSATSTPVSAVRCGMPPSLPFRCRPALASRLRISRSGRVRCPWC